MGTKRKLPLQSGRARTFPRVACLHGDHAGSAQGCTLISVGSNYNDSEIILGKLCTEEKVNYLKGRNIHRVEKVQADAQRPCALCCPH